MSFTMKYPIVQLHLTSGSKRRPGLLINEVKFLVAHDTGNPNSTARGNVGYYERSRNEQSASAHFFVDDKEIIECIPVLSGSPEKAWHVLYNVITDNVLYGANANDAAIGVEYCYGDRIDSTEAYRRYVWLLAYLCYTFKLDPTSKITGHCFLDPKRKTDPVSGLLKSRRTYDQLLKDIAEEYNECIGQAPTVNPKTAESGEVRVVTKLNLRSGQPKTSVPVIRTVMPGETLKYVAKQPLGQSVNGNTLWYEDADGNYFWSGGVEASNDHGSQV